MSSKPAYDPAYEGCFVCGRKNPDGLRLDFAHDPQTGEVLARVSFPPAMQGFENVVHGGFLSMLLDEVMAKACLARGIPAVTARMELRFKKPVLVGEEIEARGMVLEVKGRKLFTRARCTGGSGEVKALADGLFVRL
jgi:acyl-coenzyme A thioesterase PaaI-like protein